MATIPTTDVAFEGFRLTRERPRVLLYWGAAVLVLNLITALLMIALVGAEFDAINAAMRRPSDNPEEAAALLARLAPVYAIGLPLGLLEAAVLQSAVYRAVLRPEDSRWGYLRLGADELRVLAVLVLLALVFFFGGLLAATLAAVISAAIGAAGRLIGLVLFPAVVAGLVWGWVRLSLAPPQTFAEGRINALGSWRLTSGVFWPLLGAYALALVLALVVGLLALAIYTALAAVIAGGVGRGLFQPDYSSLAAYLTPSVLLGVVVNAAISALLYAVMLAPAAVAYRLIAGRTDPSAAGRA